MNSAFGVIKFNRSCFKQDTSNKQVQLLLIKLLLTPLLMIAISWAARRWGPGIGGLLAGLPLTSGPISISLWVGLSRDRNLPLLLPPVHYSA
jgi:hypothetical protein